MKYSSRLSAAVVFLLVAGTITAWAGTTNTTTKPADNKNTSFKEFGLQYPASWKMEKRGTTYFLVAPREGNFANNVSIRPMKAPPQVSLVDVIKEVKRQLPSIFKDVKFVADGAADLGQIPDAHYLIYTATVHNVKAKFKQVIARSGKATFVFTYTAEGSRYDKDLPAVEQMLHSFTIPREHSSSSDSRKNPPSDNKPSGQPKSPQARDKSKT